MKKVVEDWTGRALVIEHKRLMRDGAPVDMVEVRIGNYAGAPVVRLTAQQAVDAGHFLQHDVAPL